MVLSSKLGVVPIKFVIVVYRCIPQATAHDKLLNESKLVSTLTFVAAMKDISLSRSQAAGVVIYFI